LIQRTVRLDGLAVLLVLLLSACGGGGSDPSPAPAGPPVITQFVAERGDYFIGERTQLTVRFENGTGRIEPGGTSVRSGQVVASQVLEHGLNEFELIVSDGTTTVRRTLIANAGYRERIRSVDVPFSRGEHAAARLSDGRVIFFGGEDENTTFPTSIWAFDPVTEQFGDYGPKLSTGRVGFVSVTLYDANILIAGGERGLTSAPSAEIVRTSDATVVPTIGSLQHPRTFAAATMLMDGKVFICGGTAQSASRSVEIYDPTTGTFTLLPGLLSVGRHGHTVVRINPRRMLIYGGFTLDQQVAPPELYDPIDGVSTPLPLAEPNSRGVHEAHTMQDGGVLILGGEDNDALPLTSVLRFNPATNEFGPFASLATPRSSFALGRLADARILITGGVTSQSQSDVTNTTETLSLAAARREGPVMTQARRMHTVTPLIDGRLLIVGGLGADRMPLRSAEIYD